MKCEICKKEIKENIKNFNGILVCEECRDEEEQNILDDKNFDEDGD